MLGNMYNTVKRQSMINHCDRRIILLNDTDTVIFFGLFNLFLILICLLGD